MSPGTVSSSRPPLLAGAVEHGGRSLRRPLPAAGAAGRQPGGRAELCGVRIGIAQRLGSAFGDEVGHVGLEPVQEVLALIGRKVAETRSDGGDEGVDLWRESDRLVHEEPPCSRLVTVVEKWAQSSRWVLSWARPEGVIP